ncbi:MAG: sigma-70 family RNA polymerase sigma factor [Paraglaciecola sp.]|nr:sigma-70 family RNA polymerase sigma factor [Paraglaciecola sp.]
MDKSQDVTGLLILWQQGSQSAFSELSSIVYCELKKKANYLMSMERKDHTLQATALVNESFLKLMNSKVELQDRLHFYWLAGRIMRQILVDHARMVRTLKRGAEIIQITLNADHIDGSVAPNEFLDLDDAMKVLSSIDARKADILELQFFAGLTVKEIASLYGVSLRTVERDRQFAKAWLQKELTIL